MTVPIGRRSFLAFVGLGLGAPHALATSLTRAANPERDPMVLLPNRGTGGLWTSADGIPSWSPPAYPLPLPGDGGTPETDAERFAQYEVRDDLILPDGFDHHTIAMFGDTFTTADGTITFGTGADYTGLIPIRGTSNEFYLMVNHEYVSGRPYLEALVEDRADPDTIVICHPNNQMQVGSIVFGNTAINPAPLPEEPKQALQRFASAAMDALGVSVLHVRRDDDGLIRVIDTSTRHRRVSGVSSIGFDESARSMTGPSCAVAGVNANVPPRTFANCSGAITPWGTLLTCEENYQDQIAEFVAPDGSVLYPSDTRPMPFRAVGIELHRSRFPFEFLGLAAVADPTLDPRSFGWVVEIDPATGRFNKHTALGRFRHENVALRCEANQPLAAYMGDDRRGGHVWKFVSDDAVSSPEDPKNAALLERGTLYAAQFHDDFHGRWLPLALDTPLQMPRPEDLTDGLMWLPARPTGGHVLVGDPMTTPARMTVADWVMSIESWCGKPFDELTLGDLVRGDSDDARLGVLLMEAHAMANAIGGTPCARPEDVEVHPIDQSIYIAFTDSTGSGDGTPHKAIFPDSARTNSRQYGAVYRIREEDDRVNALTFEWGRFVSSGEVAEGGGGFACADNLMFDDAANLWMVTDITTGAQNFPVDRERRNTSPGESLFRGVFGNNALFCIPTTGERAGLPTCFAIGPTECELTGPTIVPGGHGLIVAVQHPGEMHGTRTHLSSGTDVREIVIAGRDGTLLRQQRVVPLGSNFPSGKRGDVPRPGVVQIYKTQ